MARALEERDGSIIKHIKHTIIFFDDISWLQHRLDKIAALDIVSQCHEPPYITNSAGLLQRHDESQLSVRLVLATRLLSPSSCFSSSLLSSR
jgi:hypothetical protein